MVEDNKNNIKDVPYLVHEYDMTRMERTNERLWIIIIILIILFVGSIAYIIYVKDQYEDVVVTTEVDTGEGDATVTGVGDIFYGENKTDGENETP